MTKKEFYLNNIESFIKEISKSYNIYTTDVEELIYDRLISSNMGTESQIKKWKKILIENRKERESLNIAVERQRKDWEQSNCHIEAGDVVKLKDVLICPEMIVSKIRRSTEKVPTDSPRGSRGESYWINEYVFADCAHFANDGTIVYSTHELKQLTLISNERIRRENTNHENLKKLKEEIKLYEVKN